MPQRKRAIVRFCLRSIGYAVFVVSVAYIAGILTGHRSSAQFLAGFADDWFVLVPVYLAMGVLLTLYTRWLARWETRRVARRESRKRSGGKG